MYHMVPKFHYFFHLGVFSKFGNPRVSNTYDDEDYVGRRFGKWDVLSIRCVSNVLLIWTHCELAIGVMLRMSNTYGFETEVYGHTTHVMVHVVALDIVLRRMPHVIICKLLEAHEWTRH